MTQIIEPIKDWKQKKERVKRRTLLKGLWAIIVLCLFLVAVFGNWHSFECFCAAVGGGVALGFM